MTLTTLSEHHWVWCRARSVLPWVCWLRSCPCHGQLLWGGGRGGNTGSENVMREIQSEHNIEDLKVEINEETNHWFSQGEGEVAAAGVQEPSPQVESVYLPTNTLCDFDPEPNCYWKCWNLGTCESATTSGKDQYWHYGCLGQWQWRRWTGGSTFNWHSDWYPNYYGQAFYAGGSSTSGNVILGPKKKKFNVGDVFKVEKKFKYKAQSSLVSGCKRCRCRGGSSWGAWWCWRVRWHQVECSLCVELLLIIAISGRFREVASN